MADTLYTLRLSFTDDGYLWAADDLTAVRFGRGPLDTCLPRQLPPELWGRLGRLKVKHETQYDIGVKGYGPWTDAQTDRFNARVQAVLIDLRRQLGPQFEVEFDE